MTGADLIGVAERLGPLALWLVLLAGLTWLLIDKLLGKEGFLTRLFSGVFNRELARARRDAARDLLEREKHDARFADAIRQADYLEQELREARDELAGCRDQLRQALAELSAARNELAAAQMDGRLPRPAPSEETP